MTTVSDTFPVWKFQLDLRFRQLRDELREEHTRMSGQSVTAPQQAGVAQDIFDAAANFVNRDDYCTMILDRLGRILSCGTPAERLFGASQIGLAGRFVSDFIVGLFLDGSSPSYSARYLVYLCADGVWRKFEAKDVAGKRFVVEINLARMATIGPDPEMFLLNVRRPERPVGH